MAGAGCRAKGKCPPSSGQRQVSRPAVVSSGRVRSPQEQERVKQQTQAARQGGALPHDPAQKAEYLRKNAQQTAMFSQGEDTPLFSGTAQRATIDPYQAQQTGYQEGFIEREAHAQNPFKPAPAPTYTPEYHRAQTKMNQVRARYGGNLSDTDLMQDRDYREARDRAEAEWEISEVARSRGHDPAKMTERDWGKLADDLTGQAKQELHLAHHTDREAIGHKMRGQADTWMQVGGQAMLVRSGASRSTAAAKVRSVDQETKNKADAYMGNKLVEFGYQRSDVSGLSYDQKRRLLAEVGHGEVQKSRQIGGITQSKRERVVKNTSDYKTREAKEISFNPRAGQGLKTWGQAMMAAEKAGKWIDIPPDDLYERERAPGYVRKSTPKPGQAQELIF